MRLLRLARRMEDGISTRNGKDQLSQVWPVRAAIAIRRPEDCGQVPKILRIVEVVRANGRALRRRIAGTLGPLARCIARHGLPVWTLAARQRHAGSCCGKTCGRLADAWLVVRRLLEVRETEQAMIAATGDRAGFGQGQNRSAGQGQLGSSQQRLEFPAQHNGPEKGSNHVIA